jgi:hypothetical protein
MTPREVGGLQAIAKAHGGSLTINPHTGLAEAGFLKNILPTLAGAALASTGIGAPAAAMLVGGGVGLAKGDLKAGLMAGLGAYGGAGLAGGLTSLGAQQAGEQAGAEALGTTAETMATEQGANQALTTSYPDMSGNITPETSYIDPVKGQQYSQAYSQAAQPNFANMQAGAQQAVSSPEGFGKFVDATGGGAQTAKYGLAAAGPAIADAAAVKPPEEEKYDGPLSKYEFDPEKYRAQDVSPPQPYYQAQMYNYAGGGTVEQMSNANAVGMNTGYPGAYTTSQGVYATPYQTPVSTNMVTGAADTGVNRMTGQTSFAAGGHLGSYSDGGRMLKGPGDGMSDSIPAKIGAKQPARLADGEFVVPADVVSHLGNGSSDAGAKQLYAMMDRIRAARTGKKRQAPQVKARKVMPA